jgi:acetylornithine deacetylase/succinyl-diaminopimelate desuccinylase-like protein
MQSPSAASLDMIRRLVAFDTTSRNSNLDLIHFVRDHLAGLGIESRLVPDEAGLYEQAGVPTIVCGPGSIDQAHKPNEFVALEQVARCEDFLRRLTERFVAAS